MKKDKRGEEEGEAEEEDEEEKKKKVKKKREEVEEEKRRLLSSVSIFLTVFKISNTSADIDRPDMISYYDNVCMLSKCLKEKNVASLIGHEKVIICYLCCLVKSSVFLILADCRYKNVIVAESETDPD